MVSLFAEIGSISFWPKTMDYCYNYHPYIEGTTVLSDSTNTVSNHTAMSIKECSYMHMTVRRNNALTFLLQSMLGAVLLPPVARLSQRWRDGRGSWSSI